MGLSKVNILPRWYFDTDRPFVLRCRQDWWSVPSNAKLILEFLRKYEIPLLGFDGSGYIDYYMYDLGTQELKFEFLLLQT